MDQIFLHNRSKTFSYQEFDAACAVLKKQLPSVTNKKLVVLCSQPEFYYFSFYFCFTQDFIYCPIDTEDTAQTIEDKLDILNPGVILINDRNILNRLRESDQVYEPLHLPFIGSCFLCFREIEKEDNFATADIRYILFTSGATGAAKAVPVSNVNIAAFADNMQQLFEVAESDIIANTFKFSFDLSIWTMLMAFNNRAAVCHISTEDLLKRKEYIPCSIVCILPSMLRGMQKRETIQCFLPDKIRHFLFSGEPLYTSDILLLKEYYPFAEIFNCYGPTELTVYCASYKVQEPLRSYNDIISIGRLNWGCRGYLGHVSLLPDGNIEGELYVSGDQTFQGYINMPEADIFFEFEKEKFYKTGDKVVYNRQQDLYYYTSRIDGEMKYAGHRASDEKTFIIIPL